MTRPILMRACVAALGVAATTATIVGQAPAQSPRQGQSTQTRSERTAPAPPRQSGQQITLTGCLTRDDTKEFMLLGARAPSASANRAAGVAESTSAGTRFRLSGGPELAQQVGGRVEIIGRLDPGVTLARSRPADVAVGTSGQLPTETDIDAGAAAPQTRIASDVATDSLRETDAVGTSGRAPATEHVTVTSVRRVAGDCR